MHRKVLVEVDLKRIGTNVSNIVNKYNNYEYYFGVIKGNAYGHGYGIIPTLMQNGINYLAVSSLDEAIQARLVDKKIPILMMEPVDIADIPFCQEQKLTITVSNYTYWQNLAKLCICNIKVHIKVNTGLNRLGVGEKVELTKIYEEMVKKSGIFIEGIYTHLATTGLVDDVYDCQVKRFLNLTSDIDLQEIPIVHIGRSATLEIKEKLSFANGVRIGALIYGIRQTFRDYRGVKGYLRKIRDQQIKKSLNMSTSNNMSSDLDVAIGFVLKAAVIEINRVCQGESVGYGGTFKAKRDTYIAVIAIGYKDGIHPTCRGLKVCIKNKLYPIVGIINMCMITVEVDKNVCVGDESVILGGNVCTEDMAILTQSTSYAVMTGISSSILRIYK